MSEKPKLNLARIFDLNLDHNKTAEIYTGESIIYGMVEFPESEPSSGEKGTDFKLDWDFSENGVFRVAIFRKKDPPPSDEEINAGGCYLELVKSLSIDPQTGEILPYFEAQQRVYKKR